MRFAFTSRAQARPAHRREPGGRRRLRLPLPRDAGAHRLTQGAGRSRVPVPPHRRGLPVLPLGRPGADAGSTVLPGPAGWARPTSWRRSATSAPSSPTGSARTRSSCASAGTGPGSPGARAPRVPHRRPRAGDPAGRSNRVAINRGAPAAGEEGLGILRTVVFAPEDLSLVTGGPVAVVVSSTSSWCSCVTALGEAAADYERVLRQRNALLKSSRGSRRWGPEEDATLAVWDEHLCAAGARLLHGRLHVLRCWPTPPPGDVRGADQRLQGRGLRLRRVHRPAGPWHPRGGPGRGGPGRGHAPDARGPTGGGAGAGAHPGGPAPGRARPLPGPGARARHASTGRRGRWRSPCAWRPTTCSWPTTRTPTPAPS